MKVIVLISLMLALVACAAEPTATPTPEPTATPNITAFNVDSIECIYVEPYADLPENIDTALFRNSITFALLAADDLHSREDVTDWNWAFKFSFVTSYHDGELPYEQGDVMVDISMKAESCGEQSEPDRYLLHSAINYANLVQTFNIEGA